MSIYCRRFELRNCGRFLTISSDFGSKYKTNLFLTSEALYAGLTREITREPKYIDLKSDEYDFISTYNIKNFPIWFSPGMFVDKIHDKFLTKNKTTIDVNMFNVLDEDYPGTGGGKNRKSSPTYGSMETILPNNYIVTYGVSADKRLLQSYNKDSIYLMGKKRTMFQITDLSEVMFCEILNSGKIVPTQVARDDIIHFSEYNIHAITMRYLLISGYYNKEIFNCNFGDKQFSYPIDYVPKEILQ